MTFGGPVNNVTLFRVEKDSPTMFRILQSKFKYLIINCPQASMAVQHIADLVTVRRLPMPTLSEKSVSQSR